MWYTEICIVISVFAVSFSGVQTTTCTEATINHCRKAADLFNKDQGVSKEMAYFPIYKLKADEIENFCKIGHSVTECLNKLKCDKAKKMTFKGFVDSVKYLCDETLEEYRGYQFCYSKPEVANKLEDCDQQASEQINKVLAHDKGDKTLCGVITIDYECNKDAIEPTCGKDAAKWEVTFTKKSLDPLIDSLGCGAVPHWAVILIICVLLGLCFAGIVMGLYLKKKRCSKKSDNQQFHNVLNTSTPA